MKLEREVYMVSNNKGVGWPLRLHINVRGELVIIKVSKTKKILKIQVMIKLEMSKPYGIIEWDYLQKVMIKVRFSEKWIDRIMKCVSIITYSLVNGKPTDIITPHRGLRQGDPISPYLFLLCAEGLGTTLKQAQGLNLLHGIYVA